MMMKPSEVKVLRQEVGWLRVDDCLKDRHAYVEARDALLMKFEKSCDRAEVNETHLRDDVYAEIWPALLPNERLAIEHMYYESPKLVEIGTPLHNAMHGYVVAKQQKNRAETRRHMKEALWQLRHRLDPDIVIALQTRTHKRAAQRGLLNSLGIHPINITTPNAIVARVEAQYDRMELEEILINILFPIDIIAREIAEEIQRINAEMQRLLLGQTQKSFVSESATIPEATDAFVFLTNQIMEGVRGTIEKTIEKAAKKGLSEDAMIANIEKAIEYYQDVTIPYKMEMLATHFNGKLSEVHMRDEGFSSYLWISMEDERVRASHAANDGQIFSLDNPPDTGHPGHDYNCRCGMAPVELASRRGDLKIILKEYFKQYNKRVSEAAKKVGKAPKPKPSVRNPESLRGKSIKEVERLADEEYLKRGWKKEPLKKGEGVRYTDGKGGSFQINRGYKNGKGYHKGPYVKTTVGNQKTTVPLKGNPDL